MPAVVAAIAGWLDLGAGAPAGDAREAGGSNRSAVHALLVAASRSLAVPTSSASVRSPLCSHSSDRSSSIRPSNSNSESAFVISWRRELRPAQGAPAHVYKKAWPGSRSPAIRLKVAAAPAPRFDRGSPIRRPTAVETERHVHRQADDRDGVARPRSLRGSARPCARRPHRRRPSARSRYRRARGARGHRGSPTPAASRRQAGRTRDGAAGDRAGRRR